ncbi:MAG: LysR family transcriptional regulator [Paracoccaceae bacterium]
MENLRNIGTFVEVADRLSFADAARRLGVPPSTVTTRVRALEAELGVRLLERSTRSVALTAEGAIFVEKCRRALAEIAEARALVGSAQEAEGLVRVSIPTAFPKEQFAILVGRFRDQNPGITIQITVDDRPASFVRDGVDLALRGRKPGGGGVVARKLCDIPVVFAAPAGRAQDEALPVLRPLSRPHHGRGAGEGIVTHSMELVRAFVLVGRARAYLPLPLCREAIASGQIETAPGPDGVAPPLPLFLVYQDRRHQPLRVRLFKDFLVAELASVRKGG